MNFIKHNNMVYEIEDFITTEQKEIILSSLNNTTEQDWPLVIENEFNSEDTAWGGRVFIFKPEVYDLVKDTIQAIEHNIALLFHNASRINSIMAIQRYKTGWDMAEHEDDTYDKQVKFGLIIYLNDNYEGGEIYYPSIDLKIKPKKHSLVIHPANLSHRVEKVRNIGVRYILSTFVSGNNVTVKEDILYGL